MKSSKINKAEEDGGFEIVVAVVENREPENSCFVSNFATLGKHLGTNNIVINYCDGGKTGNRKYVLLFVVVLAARGV
jgi:hypothetical protein